MGSGTNGGELNIEEAAPCDLTGAPSAGGAEWGDRDTAFKEVYSHYRGESLT
jgi:hypothetical protein